MASGCAPLVIHWGGSPVPHHLSLHTPLGSISDPSAIFSSMVGGLKIKIPYGINPDKANTNTQSGTEPLSGGERLPFFRCPTPYEPYFRWFVPTLMRSLAIGVLWTPDYFANHFSGPLFAVLSELRTVMLRIITARRGIRAGMPTFIPVSDFHRALGDAVRTY